MSRRRTIAAAMLALLPVILVPTSPTNIDVVWAAPEAAVSLATFAAIFAIVAYGLGMLMRFAGLASVVHASLWGAGAYTAGRLSLAFEFDFWLIVPFAAIVPMVLAFAVSRLALRTSGMAFLIITIAMNEFLVLVGNNVPALTNGTNGLILTRRPNVLGPVDFSSATARYHLALAFLYVAVGLVWLLGRSSFGRRLEAIRDNETLAQSAGIDALAHKTVLFVLSAGVVGVAGLLLIFHQQAIIPNQFGSLPFIAVVLMVVLGGTRMLVGPAVGAWLVTFLPQWLEPLGLEDENRQQLVFGILLVVMMLAAPTGLTGLVRRFTGSVPPAEPPPPEPAPTPAAGSVHPGRPTASAEVILRVTSLGQRFGAVEAIRELDLDIHRHEVLGIIGPNGSGKTTLFNTISGWLRPAAGDVTWRSQSIVGWRPDRIARAGLVRTFQEPMLFGSSSVLDNVRVARPAHTNLAPNGLPDGPRELLDFCGLGAHAATPVARLSYGRLRLLGVGIALSAQPELLLLDEPAAGLNPVESEALRQLLQRVQAAGVTVCVIEHDMSFLLPFCDRVVVLDAGRRIMSGTPTEVAAAPDVIASYLGKRFLGSIVAEDSP